MYHRVLVLPLLALLASPVAAQDSAAAPDATASLALQLDGIRQALHEIALVLDRGAKQQEIDVLMTRIQLKQRGLAPLETDLRSTRNERDGLSDERQRVQMTIASLEQELAPQNAVAPSDERRTVLDRMRGEAELLEAREALLNQRTVELENELRRLRDDVLILEEKVDERLGLR